MRAAAVHFHNKLDVFHDSFQVLRSGKQRGDTQNEGDRKPTPVLLPTIRHRKPVTSSEMGIVVARLSL
jgi:hypothetical protein